MGEYVAIGRSLLQQCHWGKKSPLGEDGRGRDLLFLQTMPNHRPLIADR